ncbi:MAG: nucleoside-diphosphate kinase [Micrococcales bacterium]|nr:nucleoside-diphosphate kinase [Micrococcales bacterium]
MKNKQRVLVLVKPDGVRRGLVGQVLSRIEARGFVIEAIELRQATEELLAVHYAEHVTKPFYPGLVKYMTSGPVVAVVASGDRVIESFRTMAGATDPVAALPGTIRGDLARDWDSGTHQNIVHGSDSPESAAREIAIWFPGLVD